MTSVDRDANVLGALALVVAEQTSAAIIAASGQSLSGAAALSALHQFLDRPSLDQLGRVLGLTPSGAVRLVDRLVEADLVTRGPGGDGRSRSVALTVAGRRTAKRIAAGRAGALGTVLQRLTAAQRTALSPVLDAVVAAVVADKDGGAWICRLCDLQVCGRNDGRCPAANAAAVKYGRGEQGGGKQ
ncbi:MAG: MarR family transcriptional regulator [Geodermatophilaceae bacterium]